MSRCPCPSSRVPCRDWFSQIPLPFPPYLHQEKAFLRLSSASPLNTLVATGTGSGKTECFLLPLLDHCRLEHAQGSLLRVNPLGRLASIKLAGEGN